MVGRTYGLMFKELLDYPVTLIFMYYEWAVYDLEFEVYMKSLSLGGM